MYKYKLPLKKKKKERKKHKMPSLEPTKLSFLDVIIILLSKNILQERMTT